MNTVKRNILHTCGKFSKKRFFKIILKETMLKPWSLSFPLDLWGLFFTRRMTAENTILGQLCRSSELCTGSCSSTLKSPNQSQSIRCSEDARHTNLFAQLGGLQRSCGGDHGTPAPRPSLGPNVLFGQVTLPFTGVEGKICGLYHGYVHVVSKVAAQGLCTELDSGPWPLVRHFILVHVQIILQDLLQPGVQVFG